ncbi:hypothetical protein TBK1r_45630 [Stieleria magnilauensis]|uniref:Uncharacterized protein n=1 Tax=Stieleria magnilauensis TaxID=2527963 RepID=A0ABX5XUE2_9BACT|nr:hypothetical protein TBK1r_45630 [Planctomycetes bacterium TBK1r]
MRFETPQAKFESNVPVIRSFLFAPTGGQFWPHVAAENMRPLTANMHMIATVADVLAQSQFPHGARHGRQ